MPPPPHPENRPAPTRSSTTTTAPPSKRLRFHTKKQPAIASPVAGRNGREPGRVALACALTVIVSCAFAAVPEGVTVVGLKEQVAFAGSPEQAKLTAELNPFCGVTVIVADPCEPELTVNDVGEAANVNVGVLIV